MTFLSTLTDCWLGLCRKAPALHTASAVLLGDPEETKSAMPDAGGASGSPARIRRGIGIATGSIWALFHDRRLFLFSLLAGLVILFLVAAEGWIITHYDLLMSSYLWIPFKDTTLIVFDLQLFLVEAVCLSGFTFLLAALVCYRDAKNKGQPVTFRGAFNAASRHTGMLAALSVTMALVATLLLELSAQNETLGTIEFTISMTLFWLPYAYYFAPNGVLTALFFSFQIVVANAILFLLALYVVPSIVLEDKGLISAIAGSFRLMKKTWRELLGCALVFGAIVLAVACIGLIIGQSPALLNNDYDFFLQVSRGQLLMMAACYGFLLACGVLMALGSTVLGIAVTDLYAWGRADSTPKTWDTTAPAIREPAR